MSEPTVPSVVPGRQPMTTQSSVRTRLILVMPWRSPGRYGASRRLAMTPSAVASHSRARPGSRLVSTGSWPPASSRSRARRSANGASSSDVSSRASRSKGAKAAGISRARRSTREAAGWRRCWRSPNSSPPAVAGDHDLAVEHVAPGRERELGEVALQRLAGARLDRHGVPVDEDDRAEPVELALVRPALARGQLARRARELRGEGGLEREGHPLLRYRSTGTPTRLPYSVQEPS